MKASVQFNELIGTSAADMLEPEHLNSFLKSKNIDTARYSAIGARFYAVENSYFEISVICKDSTRSTALKNHLVAITFENDISKEEFFSFFKRFEVIIAGKHFVHDQIVEEIVYNSNDNSNKEFSV